MQIEDIYLRMFTIRYLEERLQEFCDKGMAGDLHFNKGQEAISVGVCSVLSPADHIVTHHRTIAHEIAKGAKLYPLIAELLGKRTGLNGGRAGEMHLTNPDIRHDFSFQLVGTCIPVAAGIAWALKNHHKNGEVVAVFFGDAATSNGQFHEGVSLAAIHDLPLLMICENNHRAGNITPKHYTIGRGISERADGGWGITSIEVDGNSIDQIVAATTAALPRARNGEPVLIECHTERLCWHKQGQRDIRSPDELREAAIRDPLPALRKQVPDIDYRGLEAAAKIRVDLAIEQALLDLPALPENSKGLSP
jgi:pyruvate dehydrogenase E1 component alpha subunit